MESSARYDEPVGDRSYDLEKEELLLQLREQQSHLDQLDSSGKNLLANRLISRLSLMHNGEIEVELKTPFPDGFGTLRS